MNLYQSEQLKKDLPEIHPGDTIKVYEEVYGEKKKKSQVFEGIVIAKKHGKGINASFTVRSILGGIGVEKVYPLHSPLIKKIEVVKKGRARRAKLYYLREKSAKIARKKLRIKTVLKPKTNSKVKNKSEIQAKPKIKKESKKKEEKK